MSKSASASAGGSWSRIDLAGHPCDLFEPAAPNPHGFAVIYLHDWQLVPLAEHPAFVGPLAEHGLRLIAPQTGPSWWTDRVTSLFDPTISAQRYVVDHVLPFIAERWGSRPPAIGLLGVEMGAQGALGLAFRQASKFPVVAAIAPAIDYQFRWREGDAALREIYPDAESARQDTATLNLHPLNWPRQLWFCATPEDFVWHESADRLRMKLSAIGIPHESDLTGAGDTVGWSYYDRLAPAAISFLADRLQRERLRVV